MVDLQTGETVGPVCVGELDAVDITAQLDAARGRRVVSIHTHPSDFPFSPRDVQVFLSEPAIEVLLVICVDGTFYVVSADPVTGKDRAATFTVEQRFNAVIAERAGVYRALRLRGSMTKAQAWRQQSHEAWTRLGPELGLRYDRA